MVITELPSGLVTSTRQPLPPEPPPAPPKRGRGRPSSMGKVIGEVDGQLVTAKERIPELLRQGAYIETAAAASGVNQATVHDWLKLGAVSYARRHTNDQLGMPTVFTPHELACIDFNESVVKAKAEFELECNVIQSQLQRGGLKATKTTVKRGAPITIAGQEQPGPILESTTVTEILPPNDRVIAWRLTRMFPDRYGNRLEVDTAGKGGALSDADVIEQLIGSVEGFLEAGSET